MLRIQKQEIGDKPSDVKYPTLSFSASRNLVKALRDNCMTPLDLLEFPNSSYIKEFSKIYETREFVIFDTETTGLNVYEDDVVQIAAVKVKGGDIIAGSEFNILLHTDRKIPEFLGEIKNPLVEEYGSRSHCDRKEGLLEFLRYVGDDPILGHNVTYDYSIIKYNLLRDCEGLKIEDVFKSVWDSLKLARLIAPNRRSYKLKNLIESWALEGENSHLADADILATKSVVDYIYNESFEKVENQDILLSRLEESEISTIFREKYYELYRHTKDRMYETSTTSVFVDELRYIYARMTNAEIINPLPKMDYLFEFLEKNVISVEQEPHLSEQISNHIIDLNTFSEADLCDSGIIKEDVYVMTVHKAKGLEFENVIVAETVDGVYPFYLNIEQHDETACLEDARKLYVAISRAQVRLCLASYNFNRNGYPVNPSPFIKPIKKYFL